MTQQPGATNRPMGAHAHSQPAGQPATGSQAAPGTMAFDATSETSQAGAYERREPSYDRPERTSVAMPIGSRIRGGPVWGGFIIGFATWILLELALFALDLGALAANVVPNADNSSWWWSGVAAAIAFFLGGLVAGASTSSNDLDDGLLHGITVWALTVAALIVLSAAGVGIGFGAVGDLLATSPSLPEADTSAINDAQSAAGAALLALTVTLLAAAIGGMLGSKIWPRHDDTIDVRDSHRVR